MLRKRKTNKKKRSKPRNKTWNKWRRCLWL